MNGSGWEQQSVGGGGGGGESVSVLTTVYNHPSYPPQPEYNKPPPGPYPPQHAQLPPQGGHYPKESSGGYASSPYPAYAHAQPTAQPPQHHPNHPTHPQAQAQMKAQVAAVAAATATATAVAYRQQPYPHHQGHHPQQTAYRLPHGGHPAAAPGPPQAHPLPHYAQRPGSLPAQHHPLVQRLPPPPHPHYPHQQRLLRPPRHPQAQHPSLYQPYPPPHGHPSQAPRQMSQAQAAAAYAAQQQRDVKPNLRELAAPANAMEERIAFPILKPLLGPFKLEHNMELTTLPFELSPEVYQGLASKPGCELQLKCFHHDDKTQANNWPAAQSPVHAPVQQTPAVSVQVTINGQHVPIAAPLQPIYLKEFARAGQNRLDIRVFQCCCSHFFVLQLVQQHRVADIVRTIMSQSPQSKPAAAARLKSLMSGADGIERTSETIDLKCPISQQLMKQPARGVHCKHVQCFDLPTFLTLNKEKAQNWACPVCQKHVRSTLELETDLMLAEILKQAPKETEQVTIEAGGTWKPVPLIPPAQPSTSAASLHLDAPAVKRMKSEPAEAYGTPRPPQIWPPQHQHSVPASATGGHFSPAPSNGYMSSGSGGVLSPYFNGYPQPSPSQTAPPTAPVVKGPATPGRYGPGPPTPATPAGPSPLQASVGEPQPSSSQHQHLESLAGSAPYTPASVGSAGSAGQGNQANLSSDLDGITGLDFFDGVVSAGGGGAEESLNGPGGGLSPSEILRYLGEGGPQQPLQQQATQPQGPQASHPLPAQGQPPSQPPPQPSAAAVIDDLSDFFDS